MPEAGINPFSRGRSPVLGDCGCFGKSRSQERSHMRARFPYQTTLHAGNWRASSAEGADRGWGIQPGPGHADLRRRTFLRRNRAVRASRLLRSRGCEPASGQKSRKMRRFGRVSGLPAKEMRSVKKTSSSVLTSNPGLAYKPPIETAPPLSGASSALP